MISKSRQIREVSCDSGNYQELDSFALVDLPLVAKNDRMPAKSNKTRRTRHLRAKPNRGTSRQKLARAKTGQSKATDTEKTPINSASQIVIKRLDRIEENYLAVDELLTELEQRLPEEPSNGTAEEANGSQVKKPR